MSEKMKREYKKDVELFYKVFSANATATETANVERFSDIKISDIITRDYDSICNSSNKYVYMNRRKKTYRVEKERLFKKYADNIKLMTAFIHKREQELLYILNQVFKKDERTNDYNISQTIHSYTLDKLINDARKVIVMFYSKCEEFYVEGVQIFDAIVQNQIKYTTIKQVENSNTLLEKMVNDNDEVIENREIENEIEIENEVEKVQDKEVENEVHDEDVDNKINEIINDDDNYNENVNEENREIYKDTYTDTDNEYEKEEEEDYSINEGDIEKERVEV